MESFLIIYVIPSFSFCFLRKWFPFFRWAGIPLRSFVSLTIVEVERREKNIQEYKTPFFNKRELIWKRNEKLWCSGWEKKWWVPTELLLMAHLWACQWDSGKYNFAQIVYGLRYVLTDLIPTQVAEYKVVVSLWFPGCPLQLYHLQLIFPSWFRFLL